MELFFGQTFLGTGTAFVWKEHQRHFLITNWHNLSGRDPFTGKHTSKTASEPSSIRVWWNRRAALGDKFSVDHPIRDDANAPLWWIHPKHGTQIDVVALPIASPPDAEMYPINHMPTEPLMMQVGADVFVLGYPFGIGPSGLPIWKRGSIASEPKLVSDEQRFIFVDTASRPGMSGSPVIRRSRGSHLMEGGGTIMNGIAATRLVGIYSGRLASDDPLDAQLGLVWPVGLIQEIVSGGCRDK